MRTPIFALFLLSLSSAADTRWIVMRSPNFEIYSSAGERATRETLRHFEQVRGFFMQTAQNFGSPQFLIRVAVFSNRKDYEAVRPNEFAVAFLTSGRLREYIVIGNTATQAFPVAVHEYVHLLARQSGLKFPPWLDEGLAELYSTLQPRGDKILVGMVIPGRWNALQSEKWIPLETILAADHKSPYYNEKDKAGSLYNEGWALTHMLMLSPEYKQGGEKLLSAIQSGTPSVAALTQVYGKSVAAIDKDLQSYLRRGSLQGVLFDAKLEKLAERPEPETASGFDLKLMMAELGDHEATPAQLRSEAEGLLNEDPKRPEPHSLLGYLALKEGKPKESTASFAKAYELGERNPRVLWDFGCLSLAADAKAAAAALDELLRLQPDRADVRAELALAQLQVSGPAAALDTLAPVKQLRTANAVRFFEVFAIVQHRAGNPVEANKAAARMREFAKEPDDKLRVERLQTYLDRARSVSAPVPASIPAPVFAATPQSQPGPPAERPTIRRTETAASPPAEPAPLPQPHPEVRGTLVGLDCAAKPPSITVESEGRNYSFLLDRPDKVVLVGSPSGKIDMNCGPQRPRAVRVTYDPSISKSGSAGSVVRLEFVTE